jgi:hypothetical protein
MTAELPTQPDRYDIERLRLLELDIDEIARYTHTRVKDKENPSSYHLSIPLFSSTAILTMPEGKIDCSEPRLLSFLTRLLLLHYLCNASDQVPSGKWVSYSQLPDGIFYAATLVHNFRALGERFGKDRESLGEFTSACKKLGGHPVTHGDSAFEIQIFPRLAVMVIIYLGDEEFPPDAKVLVDENASKILQIDFVKLMIIEFINTLIRVAKTTAAT